MKYHLKPPPLEAPVGVFPQPCTAAEMEQAAQRLAELRAKGDGADQPIIVSRPAPE